MLKKIVIPSTLSLLLLGVGSTNNSVSADPATVGGVIATGQPILLAENAGGGDIYSYKNGSWTKVGGPGKTFVVGGGGQLYGTSPQ